MGHIIYLRYGSISFECNINSDEAIVDVCVYIVLGLVLMGVYCPGAIVGVCILGLC